MRFRIGPLAVALALASGLALPAQAGDVTFSLDPPGGALAGRRANWWVGVSLFSTAAPILP